MSGETGGKKTWFESPIHWTKLLLLALLIGAGIYAVVVVVYHDEIAKVTEATATRIVGTTMPATVAVPTTVSVTTICEAAPCAASMSVTIPASTPKMVRDCLKGTEAEAYQCCIKLQQQSTLCRMMVRELVR